MKIFLDRLGFVFHRPRFFGKTFTSIVAQGIYGGDKIVRYLDFVGNGLGFNTVKGSCFTALEPMKEKEKQKIDRALAKQSRRFHERLMKPAYPAPTLFSSWPSGWPGRVWGGNSMTATRLQRTTGTRAGLNPTTSIPFAWAQ